MAVENTHPVTQRVSTFDQVSNDDSHDETLQTSQTSQPEDTKGSLNDLEEWYRSQCTAFLYDDGPDFDDEITIEEEIEIQKDIETLVPAIKTSLQGEYCLACHNFPEKMTQMQESKVKSHRNQSVPHLSNVRYLEAGSRAGCRLCCLLFQSLYSRENCYRLEKRMKILGKPTTIMISAGLENFTLVYENMVINLLETIMISVLVDTHNSFSSTSRLSNQKSHSPLDTTKRWLAACTEDHLLCKSASFIKNPTRLLFLDFQDTPTSLENNGNLVVRLVETDNIKSHIRYATLSHCWGELDFIKLTNDTLELFKTGIPLKLLTNTFRDAITVTQTLGLQYIWIDSLCIIQDSTQDWESEAVLMTSVYGEAHVNLAASDARDGSEGMFNRPLDSVTGAIIPSSSKVPSYEVTSCTLYDEGISQTRLNSRAWTFQFWAQERMLSTRNLHFGPREIFWECRTKNACESFLDGIPEWFSTTSNFRPREPFRQIWKKIIKWYSERQLTFKRDKLVALAGIARIAQQESGDEYVAGLWRSGIEELLCWNTRGRRYNFGIPTWSWASVDNVIRYFLSPEGRSEQKLFSIAIDVSVTPSGPDPFGQLNGGVLTLGCSGILSAVTENLIVNEDGSFVTFDVRVFTSNEDLVISYSGDEYDYGVNDVKMVPIFQFSRSGESLDLKSDALSDLGSDVSLFEESGETSWSLNGLVLQSTGCKPGEFKRVGYFGLRGAEGDGKEYDKFLKALGELGVEVAKECCAETRIDPTSGKEQYVITII